jgi:hypothetical protein
LSALYEEDEETPAIQSIAGLGFSVDYNDTTRSAAATFSASTLGVR